MFLFYVDESGHAADPNQNFFILAGISVFERQSWWISEELDRIAARFNPADPGSIELHGSPMLQGRDGWKAHPWEDRVQAMRDALSVFTASHIGNRAFAVVVNKAHVSPNDPVECAFEEITKRFDKALGRMHKSGNTQRGLILFDKTVHEASLQRICQGFRTVGHRWGILRNLSEVPVFIDSKASRLIQLADLVAYSVFRKFEKNDPRFYDVFSDRFDREGSITHGLCVLQ